MAPRTDRLTTKPTTNTTRTSHVWLSPAGAAEVLGVSPKTIYRLVAAGTLPARRIRGTRALRIAALDVDRLLADEQPDPAT
jgi:excisionase family DNA binding protein